MGYFRVRPHNCPDRRLRNFGLTSRQFRIRDYYPSQNWGKIVLPRKLRFRRKARLFFPVRFAANLASGRATRSTLKVEAGRIVLTPRSSRSPKVNIVVDPITGLPVLSAGPEAQVLSSKQVSEILSDFP
jgi:hypothetical protein